MGVELAAAAEYGDTTRSRAILSSVTTWPWLFAAKAARKERNGVTVYISL